MHKIITEGKRGYKNHPATQEFINSPESLWDRLATVRAEAVKRGYHFKELPPKVSFGGTSKEWQSLDEQISILKSKGCKCKV